MTEIKNETALKKNSILRDRVFLLILFLGIIFKIAFIMYVPDAPEDAYHYITSADRALIGGFRKVAFFGQRTHYLYTLLLYSFALVFRNGFWAGKILSLISGVLTVIVLYDLSLKSFSRKSGLYAVALLSLAAVGHLESAMGVLPDSFYTLMAVCAFWLYLTRKPSWVVALTVVACLWIRVEAGFIWGAFFLMYLFSRRWKEGLIFCGLAALASLWVYLSIPKEEVSTVSKILSDRFGGKGGAAEICRIMKGNWFRIMNHLAADSRYLHILYPAVLLAGGLASLKRWRNFFALRTPVSQVTFFLGINFMGIVAMKYMRFHPGAERHFTYFIPFVALLLGCAFETLEVALGRAGVPRLSRHAQAIIYAGVLAAVFFLSAFSFPSSWGLRGRYGFLWKFAHYHDGHKAVNRWLNENLKPGENFVLTLPTDSYYVKAPKENNRRLWPQNRLDYRYYLKNKIRYVVPSDIPTDLSAVHQITTGEDYLFFKHRYSPHKEMDCYGWKSFIYEIVRDFDLSLLIGADYEKGFSALETNGRRMKRYAQLRVNAGKSPCVKISFQAEALDAPRTLLVKQRGIKLGEFNLPMRKVAALDNATSGTFWVQSEGEGVATILLESPEPIAASFKTDGKDDNPFVIFMGDVRVEESEPPHLVQVHGEGWFAPETWGRWIKDKAPMKIHTKGAGQVLLSANVKSYKIDRTLQVIFNGVKVAEYKIGKDYNFEKNIFNFELMLETKDGANILEFIAEPGAQASKSFEETRRSLTVAFNNFILVRLR